jgi:hypothetical protein
MHEQRSGRRETWISRFQGGEYAPRGCASRTAPPKQFVGGSTPPPRLRSRAPRPRALRSQTRCAPGLNRALPLTRFGRS